MVAADSPPGWTLDTLHIYLLAIIDERDRRYAQRFHDVEAAFKAQLAASDQAIRKAEDATTRRFEGVNEFRKTLSDQAGEFMHRGEANASFARLGDRIQELTDRLNKSEGKGAGLSAGWTYLVAAVVMIGTVVSIVLAVR